MSLSHYDSPNGSYTSHIPPGTAAFRKVTGEFFGFPRTEVVRDQSRCNSKRSEHCECRGIDNFTTVYEKGRPFFDWCVKVSDPLGIEAVIFQHREIGFGNPNERNRSLGDHMDHVHVGLNRWAAKNLTEEMVRALLPGEEDDVTDADHAKIAAAIQAAVKPIADKVAKLEASITSLHGATYLRMIDTKEGPTAPVRDVGIDQVILDAYLNETGPRRYKLPS